MSGGQQGEARMEDESEEAEAAEKRVSGGEEMEVEVEEAEEVEEEEVVIGQVRIGEEAEVVGEVAVGVEEVGQSSSGQSGGSKIRNPKNPNLCSNKICPTFKNSKYNQANENNRENLCPQCLKQYVKENYCLYCKQIYFEFTDDGKEWIMCDECQRWVHSECADILTNGLSTNFNCIRCRKVEVAPSSTVIPAATTRRPNTNRSSILSKVPERRKTQECMLNTFGFYWQLSPAELAEDVQKLKQYMR